VRKKIKEKRQMPLTIVSHNLKDFEAWIESFKSLPPPPTAGERRVLQSVDDPNRVVVIHEVAEDEVDALKQWISDNNIVERNKELAAVPSEFIWANDVTPE
jgi:hypothetical protein